MNRRTLKLGGWIPAFAGMTLGETAIDYHDLRKMDPRLRGNDKSVFRLLADIEDGSPPARG